MLVCRLLPKPLPLVGLLHERLRMHLHCPCRLLLGRWRRVWRCTRTGAKRGTALAGCPKCSTWAWTTATPPRQVPVLIKDYVVLRNRPCGGRLCVRK